VALYIVESASENATNVSRENSIHNRGELAAGLTTNRGTRSLSTKLMQRGEGFAPT
jgi:hypothetical protein